MEPQANYSPPGGEGNFAFRGVPVTERLEAELRDQIRKGILNPGDLVKPVRELARAYALSYNSVRRVLATLAEEGLLSMERGRGTFIRNPGNPVPSRPETPVRSEAPRVTVVPRIVEARPSSIEQPLYRVEARPAPDAWPHRRSFALLAPRGFDPVAFGYRPISEALQQRILENGDTLTLIPCHRREGWPSPHQLEERGIHGVLLYGISDPAVLMEFANGELPCVLLNHWPDDLVLTGVVADNFSGAYLIAKQLLQAGHREVALLHGLGEGGVLPGPGRGDSNLAERESACRLALKEEGLGLLPEQVLTVNGKASAEELAALVLAPRPRPTAVLASDPLLAGRLLEGLQARGISVPRELSIACFTAAGEANPWGFTAARIDFAKLGESAVNRLRQLMAGAPRGRLRINVPVDVVPGKTVGPPGGMGR